MSTMIRLSLPAAAPVALQRLLFSALSFLLMASLAKSWPNRIQSGLVCENLHVTHPGANPELERGSISLVLLRDGQEVQCYEPDQYYEGTAACGASLILQHKEI